MAQNKTRATPIAVADFVASVADPVRRADAETLVALFEVKTGEPATMWGPSIVGFGSYDYTYDSGRSGTMCRIGFSPRKPETVLYVLGDDPRQQGLLARLGKHRTGKSCLYIKRLSEIDMDVLKELIDVALADMDRRYPRARSRRSSSSM